MPNYANIVHKNNHINITSIRDTLSSYKQKEFFWPNGLQIYSGKQGSGKTISSVYALHRLKKEYPKAIVVTNLELNFNDTIHKPIKFTDYLHIQSEPDKLCSRIMDAFNSGIFQPDLHYIQFNTVQELSATLSFVNNGYMGVIYIIDEIHLYFNSLNSKNIPVSVMTEVSQQRKQRKLIIGTSQVFARLAKPFREQADNIIICKTYFGTITKQSVFESETLVDDSSGHLVGNRLKYGYFFQTRELRNSFDTYQKVISSTEQYIPTDTQTIITAQKKPRGYKKAL